MNWYYVEQGQQAGPVSDEQLDEMLRSGKILPDTLVWHDGMTAWTPCREARGGAASSSGAGIPVGETPEAVCSECGKIFPLEETIRYGNARVCAACKPVFLQKLSEGAAINTGGLNYAGFWIRFAAKFLDGLIIGVPFMIVFFTVVMIRARSTGPSQFSFLPLILQFGFIFIRMALSNFLSRQIRRHTRKNGLQTEGGHREGGTNRLWSRHRPFLRGNA